MSLAGAIALLQAALMLMTLVQAHPELGDSARANAIQVAQQAITSATVALAQPQIPDTSAQNANAAPASSLINTITCPHITVPQCAGTLRTAYDNNNCITGYSCQLGTTAAPPETASCASHGGLQPEGTKMDGPTISGAPYYGGAVVLPLWQCHTGVWTCSQFCTPGSTYTYPANGSCTNNGQVYANGQSFYGYNPLCATVTAIQCAQSTFICTNGLWVSGATDGSSCNVYRHCGNITVPNGGVVESPGGVVNSYRMCTNGNLVTMSVATYGGTKYSTYCPGDVVVQ